MRASISTRFYNRASFSFFHKTLGAETFFSGESTDVVAHEVGHGLVDSIRPAFFSVNFLEVAAFHEAAGDCVAILTALNDLDTRKKLLAVTTTLKKKNFVESTAEQLSRAIGVAFPGHNASEPRHAFNTFQYQLPQTLPSNGGPGALINEAHSFGMLFSGSFWNLIVNIFAASASRTPASLLAAVLKAAGLVGAMLEDAVGRINEALAGCETLPEILQTLIYQSVALASGGDSEHVRGPQRHLDRARRRELDEAAAAAQARGSGRSTALAGASGLSLPAAAGGSHTGGRVRLPWPW